MILKIEKKFLQYDAQKSHVSKIVGVGVKFLLNTLSLRRWVATMYLAWFYFLISYQIVNLNLVRGV